MPLIWPPRWLKKLSTSPRATSGIVNITYEDPNIVPENLNNAPERPTALSENLNSAFEDSSTPTETLFQNIFTLSGSPKDVSEHFPTFPRFFSSNSSSSSGASTASTTTLNKIFDKYKGKLIQKDI